MSILAQYQNLIVEVLDVYTDGAGVKWASVEAQDGQPFVAGDKWPVRTRFGSVKVCELSENSQPAEKKNLLDLALSQAKEQWYSGESVWIWRNGNKGVFLKNDGDGFVSLNVTGFREYLNFFHLDPETWSWRPCRELEKNYESWATKAQKALK